MLQSMRELAKSWVFKSLMMLLIISFGIWGIGDIFRGNPQQRAVAKVGKVTVTIQDLERAFQESLPEARRIFGPELTVQKAKQYGILERTLNLMLDNSAFDQETARLGLKVSDLAVMEKIAAMPQFRDKDGNFNKQLWHRLLGEGNLSEQAFLTRNRAGEARGLLIDALTVGFKPPQNLVDTLYSARGAKRVYEVISLRHDSLSDLPSADDKTLETFYTQHSDHFVAPEYRAITLAQLASEDVAKDLQVSDDELKAAYEGRSADLTKPEQRDLLQVVTQDEAKAKTIAASAKSGQDLNAAAKANGANAVPLNGIDEKSVLPELYTTAFALTEGEIGGPVKTTLGWHVLQLKKIHPGGKPPFTEIEATLRTQLQNEKAGDAVARLVNQLDDSLAAGHPLEEIADSLKLRLIKIPALSAQGKTPESKAPAELPMKAEALQAAFGQNAGETSQVLDDKAGHYIVVRTDDITPSQTLPFAKVKETVTAAWRAEQQAEAAAKQVETIAQALRDGKKSASFVTMDGIEVHFAKPLSALAEPDPTLPVSVLPQLLTLKKDDVITAAAPDRHYVLRLADIVPADPAKPDSTRVKIVDELQQRLPLDGLQLYTDMLHQRFPMTIHQDVFDALKKQGS